MPTPDDPVLPVVRDHITAFNAGDVDALVAGFAEDAVFAAQDDVVVGRRALRPFFAESFAGGVRATLEIHRAVVDGDTAACELVESLEVGGARHVLHVAAFYTVRAGQLARVRIYRDLPGV